MNAHEHHQHHGGPQGAEPSQTAPAVQPGLAALTTATTAHCLLGCAIGELAGLAIGVSLGWGPWPTMAFATALGFAGGFALSLRPLLRTGMSLGAAWRSIWLGETISIAVMEFAMNATDFAIGGVSAASVASPVFWIGYGSAIVAGFAAAWPVNFWMLKTHVKSAHHH